MINLAPIPASPRKGLPGLPRVETRRAPPPPPAPPPRRRTPLGWLLLLLLLVLAGFAATASGGVWLWQQQQDIVARLQPGATLAAPPDGKLTALEQRLTQVEQRPAPAPVAAVPVAQIDEKIGALDQRLAQLEQRPAPAVPVAVLSSQLGTLEQRVTQLEQRPIPSPAAVPDDKLNGLDQRLTQLEQRPAPPPVVSLPAAPLPAAPAEAQIGTLEERVARLEQRPLQIETPAGAEPGGTAPLAGRLLALEQRVGQAEQAIRSGAARAARLQAASAALESGRPLGDVPGAPPALARFAIIGPPTEASLRVSFPAASGAAARAGDPAAAGSSLPWRMWQQVQSLVNIREGDTVLVGTPVISVLAQAQARLDAGDLAGAVAALDQLDGPAAKAIAGWREQAQSLLDARAALAGLGHS